jgi:hypothetical protein
VKATYIASKPLYSAELTKLILASFSGKTKTRDKNGLTWHQQIIAADVNFLDSKQAISKF